MHTLDIHKLNYQIPAETVFQYIETLDMPVWLDSGYPSANHSRFDILSALPRDRLFASNTIQSHRTNESISEFIEQSKSILSSLKSQKSSTSIPFKGGLIGYLGYDLGREKMGLPVKNERSNLENAYFGLYLWACIYDHHSQAVQLVFHPECDKDSKKIILKLIELSQSENRDGVTGTKKPKESFQLLNKFIATESQSTYAKNLQAIDKYILEGDVYQVNYAHHFSAIYQGKSSQAYLSQRKSHPAPYSAYIGLQEQSILCHSPEQFIQLQGRDVQTQPIKGTAPRADNAKIDQRNAEVLQSSTKDRAENLMIVDLLRNDLGKSCEPGSISVPKLFELQSFSNVHHLVSQVRGRISEGKQALDLIRDCHPGGSITGAPKRRAMEIIDELESVPRGAYCGSIGFISCCGEANMNIAIRTMVTDGDRIHCWGGGGIVADSDAGKEYQETIFKVGPMMRTLEEDYLQQPIAEKTDIQIKKGQHR